MVPRVGGCYAVVTQPELLGGDAEQAVWLETRLAFMKTSGARHLLVFHRFSYSCNPCGGSRLQL